MKPVPLGRHGMRPEGIQIRPVNTHARTPAVRVAAIAEIQREAPRTEYRERHPRLPAERRARDPETATAIVMPAGLIGGSGQDGGDPILIESLDARPGSTIPVYFQSGDGEGARVDIPVLDGSLDYLADLVP